MIKEDKFIITSGSKFITCDKGKYVEICNKNKATVFTYEKAYSVLNTNLHKKKRKYYTIEKLEVPKRDDSEHVNTGEEHIQPCDDKIKCGCDTSTLTEGALYWYNRINGLHTIRKDAEQRKEELSILHREIEKAEENVKHELELEKFNACEGYKLAIKLKKILMKRREIKDELMVIGYILRTNIEKDSTFAKKSIEGLTTRQYKQRKVSEFIEI